MTNQILNRIDTDLVRRSFIGLCLGGLCVLLLSLFLNEKNPSENMNLIFDSEVITVKQKSKIIEKHDEEQHQHKPAQDHHNPHAENYHYFNRHHASLTQAQIDAIAGNKPRLSVIINNIGLNRALNKMILEKMSHDVTIGLSPYISSHYDIANQFDDYGFEIWMDLSTIVAKNHSDQGALALSPINNIEHNIALLSKQLENKDKLTGVILPENSLITKTYSLWKSLVYDLFAQGYGILDNTKMLTKPALFFHDDKRAPYIKGDVSLHQSPSIRDLKKHLQTTRKAIADNGNVIITIPVSTPITLDILAQWLDSLSKDDITLIPLSAQAKLQ